MAVKVFVIGAEARSAAALQTSSFTRDPILTSGFLPLVHFKWLEADSVRCVFSRIRACVPLRFSFLLSFCLRSEAIKNIA